MAKILGRTGAIGIGKETTKGTAVVPTYWIPVQSYSHDDKAEHVKNDSVMGRIEEYNAAHLIKKWGEGDYEGKIFLNSVGAELTALFGKAPTSTQRATSGVYDHAFSLQNDNDHKSLTLSYKDALQALSWPLGMIDTWSLDVAVDDYVKRSLSIKSKKSETATLTPAIANEVEFIPKNVSFKMASAQSGLAAASAINVTSFNLEVSKNVEELYVLGNEEPHDIINKQVGVTGSVEMYFESTTYRDYYFANTHRAIRLDMTDVATDLGSGHNPQLYFDLNEVVFDEFERGWDPNDPLKQTLNFEALYNLADAAMITARLTNLVTSY